ncbi:MAG: hypothetical protein AAGJ31_03220 [Verrucomicrobiota bacterium]
MKPPAPEALYWHMSCGMEADRLRRKNALFEGQIPPLMHYQSVHQSRLWMDVARAYQPEGLDSFYRQVFAGAASLDPPDHLVGLGCGGGWKERWLWESLPTKGAFTAIEVAPALAMDATAHLREVEGVEVRPPLIADLLTEDSLVDWLDQTGNRNERRWFTAFGLTPNTRPSLLQPALKRLLRSGDHLWISANLLPKGGVEAIRQEYENELTRR